VIDGVVGKVVYVNQDGRVKWRREEQPSLEIKLLYAELLAGRPGERRKKSESQKERERERKREKERERERE